jgi:hypothetical protein
MIVKYKNKILRHSLTFGLLWIVIGTINVILDNSNLYKYSFVILGLMYLANYIYQKHYHYLNLTDSSITKNGLFSKTLLFSDINRVTYIAGEYSLFTATKKLTIYKDLVDPSSLEELETIIERLKL